MSHKPLKNAAATGWYCAFTQLNIMSRLRTDLLIFSTIRTNNMKTVYLTLVMFIYFSSSAIADTVMSCNSKKKESILLTQAPTGATRIGKHTLEVKHLKGAKRFTDKKIMMGFLILIGNIAATTRT